MIKSIQIRNFKSLSVESGKIQIKPITILIGPNSSGKSSYLQMLLMLKQTIESRDRFSPLITNSNYVNLGSYSDFVYNHKVSNPIEIKFEINLKNRPRYYLRTKTKEADSYGTEDHIKDYFPFFDFKENFTYEISFYRSSNLQINVGSIKVFHQNRELFSLKHVSRGGYEFGSDYLKFENKGEVHRRNRPIKFYGFPLYFPMKYSPTFIRFIFNLERSIETSFNQLYYIGPLREYPKRLYVVSGERPQDVGLSGEKSLEVLILSKFKKTSNIINKVNYWLEKFEMAAKIDLDRLRGSGTVYYLNIQDIYSGNKANIADVGFGVSQILPLIIETFYCPDKSTLIIEQPEIHLHPKVQSEFSDMIIEGSKRINFIIETHSEHLLTRLQRRVADGSLDVKDIVVYFCNKGKNGTILKELELTEEGNFKEWPQNLFGDELEDHFQIILASSKKNKNLNKS